MKRSFLFFAVCLSLSAVSYAQTRKPAKRTATQVVNTPAQPSANGKFKFDRTKGFINETDVI